MELVPKKVSLKDRAWHPSLSGILSCHMIPLLTYVTSIMPHTGRIDRATHLGLSTSKAMSEINLFFFFVCFPACQLIIIINLTGLTITQETSLWAHL